MLKKTIITVAISAVIGGAVALAPVDAFARGGGGGGGGDSGYDDGADGGEAGPAGGVAKPVSGNMYRSSSVRVAGAHSSGGASSTAPATA